MPPGTRLCKHSLARLLAGARQHTVRTARVDPGASKGWSLGPWNSNLGIAIGYANAGIDEPHAHARIAEVYLVARGTATLRAERETLALRPGDVVVIEPGEAHTFLSSSPDYLHFVLHVPGLLPSEAQAERRAVPRSRLGLT